ncbi:hypothetical protein F4861DRAFT_90229 [Xylaria intraflava]|nr:hypothetical protein F4861DRAFT_90229 [Xylaria intraflava]
MSADHMHRMALGDATNRANLSPAEPLGMKYPDPTIMPSSAEFYSMPVVMEPRAMTPLIPTINDVSKIVNAGAVSRKRKAPTTLEEDIAAYKQNLDDVISPHEFEDDQLPSCHVIRGRINKLLDSGIMNKTEFTKAIGCNSASLSRFMQSTGPMGGSGSSVYYNAWVWFKQREVAKLRIPSAKKRAEAAAATMVGPGGGRKPSASMKTVGSLPDISGIHLVGEETDEVPVYESCDEIRKKINAHLKTPGLTQAQFCRDMYAQLNAPKCKGIQSKQLADFRALKGPRAGARSSVFYAAYVYFEKLRIAQNKPMTAHRETMEELWAAEGGFSRREDHRTMYIGLAGVPMYMDQFGMMANTGYF